MGAVAGAVYGVLGVRGLLRGRAGRRADRERRQRLDRLCGIAADLRAGLPVADTAVPALSGTAVPARAGTSGPPLTGTSGPALGGAAGPAVAGAAVPALAGVGGPAVAGVAAGPDRIERLTRAAVDLAERTGAPLAELVERIEDDARCTDRGLAAAAAQAAGARATAWLLAALPLGGVGLGYGIGVDPVAVLLHTPVGGVAAVAAVALQVTGLFWTERLTRPGGGGVR
ncbi:tight adherence protein B [Micromonospora endolithica]|nr:tight adherence protein B [Micromonospora endolithica]